MAEAQKVRVNDWAVLLYAGFYRLIVSTPFVLFCRHFYRRPAGQGC